MRFSWATNIRYAYEGVAYDLKRLEWEWPRNPDPDPMVSLSRMQRRLNYHRRLLADHNRARILIPLMMVAATGLALL